MRAGALLIGCLIVFGLLSLTDYTQTFALITNGNGSVYEANPVADAWLEKYGWAGLAVFKAGTVLVFVVAAVLVARRSPRAGIGIAAAGCAALLSVTSYSHGLLLAQAEPHVWEVAAEDGWTENEPDEPADPTAPLPGWPPPPVPR